MLMRRNYCREITDRREKKKKKKNELLLEALKTRGGNTWNT